MVSEDSKPPTTELRRLAEARLERSPAATPKSGVDSLRLLHELQVHQMELEIQNEELLRSRNELDEALRRTREGLRLMAGVFSHAWEALVITSPDGRFLDVNEAFSRITGYARDSVLGENAHDLDSHVQDSSVQAELWRDLNQRGNWQGEFWNRRENGESYAEMLSVGAVRDEQGQLRNYVVVFSDITALKEQQRKLEHLALYDTVTGLPNRMLLVDSMRHAMADTLRRGHLMAVVYLDLDGFKRVNDAHGHETGDRLLRFTAGRMRQALRDVDTLARLGGDEFIALLVDLDNRPACQLILERLLTAAAEPLLADHQQMRISVSMGVTFFPQAQDTETDELLRQADHAMYQAKQAGKNRYHFFDPKQDR